VRVRLDRFVAVAVLCITLSSHALGAPRRPSPPRPPPRPFPAPPTLPLVRVEVARDHVLVVHDVLLRRGDWTSGDLDAFVAFGAPGVPRAIDARLYAATAEDDDDPGAAASFEPIAIGPAFRRPAGARLLLGSGAMAGAVLHLREAAFRRATAATGIARVRVRTLMDLPAPDVKTGHEVVVRLGAHEGEPYALGAIVVASDDVRPWVVRAEAHLCGPDADPWPLAVRVEPAPRLPSTGGSAQPSPIAPVLSVRHASDDLCVRFWTTSDATRAPQSALGS
jgi:hypothetical protein